MNREESFELIDEWNIDKYLGIDIMKYKNWIYELK